MDSDAFILPDYIHGCASRSHHRQTHGGIGAPSPSAEALLFFVWLQAGRVWGRFLSGFFISFFLVRGGYATRLRIHPAAGD